MIAIAPPSLSSPTLPHSPQITWEPLPADFILPDDPVDNQLQPLLAAALRDSLELAGLVPDSALIATNFGLCATVNSKIVVKAPDWVYIPQVKPQPDGAIRRSYTPQAEGDHPLMVLEFISETEGGEYSINPHYPYGKWHFYERILQVPFYGIFHPQTNTLELYRLVNGQYTAQHPNASHRFWIAELNLFLGTWPGQRSALSTHWLRWWDAAETLLPWSSEVIDQERQRTEQERQRAEQERQRAEQAESQLQREQALRQQLLDRLQALGIDLDGTEA
ncbi:Uma2 family endonuclease [Prochlorothrix hollandica]|uniref:Uma2 family endonuclease n=1 Tax=Prochlorothrix hollandica TaxID=1223 RepID=UPI003340B06E